MSLTPQPVRQQPGSPADTIFALASGAGQAAIGVLRLSGDRTGSILAALCGVPAPRRASLRTLRSADGGVLDQALVLWMPGPASYTGEDAAELQVHGGRAVVQAVTQALLALGARPADAGEFTRRAFLSGRMDLLEAEAIADLVQADTEGQRRQALMQSGAAALVADWTERLTRALAVQEALIDFPDETAPEPQGATASADLAALAAEMDTHLAAAPAGERVRAGLTFVIAGPPNAGKSSLFNTLAGREAAIVSPSAGTTRDMLDVQLDLGGVAVTLVDTAGLREAEDEVEAEGVRRARARLQAADLVIYMLGDAAAPDGRADLLISGKADSVAPVPGTLAISAHTGQGIDTLLSQLAAHAVRLTTAEQQPVLIRARHVAALRDAAACLHAACHAELPELCGEELRLARAALGRLSGRLDTEAMLDVVFGAFCIGK